MKKIKPLNINAFYWFLPLVPIAIQLIYSLKAGEQIRYEDLAESVRNPFWLEHRRVYDGISSNIGWYGSVLVIYKLFGFSLFAAKIYRLFLAAVALYSCAYLLQIFISKKWATLPLLVIGLSPSLLFFNTLQTSFGLDLNYSLVCLGLIVANRFNTKLGSYFCSIFLGMLAMIAAMSFPVFIFYLPFLFIFFLWRQKSSIVAGIPLKYIYSKHTISCLLSFASPLIFGFLYVENRYALIFDPLVRSGIFRGGGRGMYKTLDPVLENISHVLSELFTKGSSYYFEVANSDFSGIAAVSFFAVVVASVFLTYKGIGRWSIFSAAALFFGNLIMVSIAIGPEGLRRCTGLLAAFYFLFSIVWVHFVKNSKWKLAPNAALVIGGTLLLHHLWVLPENYRNLVDPSRYDWFSVKATAKESFEHWLNETSDNPILDCRSLASFEKGGKVHCRYPEIYSALAGHYLWNEGSRKNLFGFNVKTNSFTPLTLKMRGEDLDFWSSGLPKSK